LGASYVIECTTRLLPFPDHPLMSFKHHPHVHMVAVAPYIHPTKLDKWCQQLMGIGLGRIDYEAIRVKNNDGEINYSGRKRVSDYIVKYLTKTNRITRTFGVVRKRRQ